MTDRAAEVLPDIFRYWKTVVPLADQTFGNFINWFKNQATKENDYTFNIINSAEEPSTQKLHPGTADAIARSLQSASAFFDRQENCVAISENTVLVKERLSVIDLSSKETTLFGAILLRHLLAKIYEAKAIRGEKKDVPILIIIDEVHRFIGSNASAEALEELSAIARMGRSEKIGVIFASQNPQDLPKGLTTIVNTRIFFRSLEAVGKKYDSRISGIDLASLADGYASMSTSSVPQIKFVKFPMSRMGVKSD
jgi:DNA helicase HerA-like ATPase